MAMRSSGDRGLTLVELMVTMVIASVVAGATFMFFAGQQRVYETQTKLLNVQQNAWASMEVLTRFIRANGSGMYGCVRRSGGGTVSNGMATTPLTRTPDVAVDDSDDPPLAIPKIRDLSQTPNAGLRAHVGGPDEAHPSPVDRRQRGCDRVLHGGHRRGYRCHHGGLWQPRLGNHLRLGLGHHRSRRPATPITIPPANTSHVSGLGVRRPGRTTGHGDRPRRGQRHRLHPCFRSPASPPARSTCSRMRPKPACSATLAPGRAGIRMGRWP